MSGYGAKEMTHQQNALLLIILMLFYTFYSSNAAILYPGDICHDDAKDTNGECKKIDECESAKIELKEGKIPQICGFEGTMAIVCCVPTPSITITRQETTNPQTTPVKTNRNVGDRAKQKCKDYEDLAWIRERPPILIPGQEFTKRSICPWQPGVTPVIIDGEAAKQGEFPHMALVGYTTESGGISWDCGGSLISENFVLTAAHCSNHRLYGSPTTVRLGDLNYTDPTDDRSAQQIEIEAIYDHPDYKPPINYNDITLLKLARPAKLHVYVKPICLYPKETINFEKAIVTGWGHTEQGGDKSDLLLKAALDVFSTAQCSLTYRNDKRTLPHGVDEKLQLCAGSFTDRKDTCQGDSGGPIQIRSKNTELHCSYYLLGVTSFGKLCGNQNIPAIYTKCFPYLKWIEDIVWP